MNMNVKHFHDDVLKHYESSGNPNGLLFLYVEAVKKLEVKLQSQQAVIALAEQVLYWHERSEVDYQGFRDLEKALSALKRHDGEGE